MMLQDKTTYVGSNALKQARKVVVMISAGEAHFSIYMTVPDALKAIEEIQRSIAALPSEATAADLGIQEAA